MALDITLRNIEQAPAPVGHYSHTATAGGLVFISGQLPVAADGTPRCEAPFEEQAQLVLQNIESCLACAGVTKQHLVSVRVYITDISLWPVFNRLICGVDRRASPFPRGGWRGTTPLRRGA